MCSTATAVSFRELPDHVLIEFARFGNGDAYEELVRRSWDICTGLAAGTLGNRSDAHDTVQYAFWPGIPSSEHV